MSDLDLYLPAFHDELVKQAALGKLLEYGRRVAPGVGAGMGTGLAVGGIGGAGLGAVQGAQQAREQGGSGVAGGLIGALKGGMTGAALGAGVGAVGGGVASALGRGARLEGQVAKEGLLGSSARFGQRQVHGVTGWTPKGGIQGIGGGSTVTGKELAAAKKGGGKRLARAEKSHELAKQMEEMGATSLPGYVKSMAQHGVGKTVGTGVKQQWHGSGPIMKSLLFGMPAATVGGALATPSEPGGPGRLERAGKAVGDVAWAMGPLPVAGQALAAYGLGEAGKRSGRLLGGRKKGPGKHVPAEPSPEPAGGEAVPAEHMVSNRRSGGMMGAA